MTEAEQVAFNKGVETVLTVATRSALRIARLQTRPVHEAFAVEVLAELAEQGRALMLPIALPDAHRGAKKVVG